MNKVFKKQNVIILDESYTLSSDGASGIVLTFSEMREREKTTKIDGKVVKTGEMEDFLFEDKDYYTRIEQALRNYAEKSQNKCKTIEEILKKTDEMMEFFYRLDREFKQFE